MKKLYNQKGISLIVLIITIIVMIVIAGTIILSLSNSGIFNKALEAMHKTSHVAIKQSLDLVILDYKLDTSSNNSTFMDFLKINGYIDENGVIDITKLGGIKGNIGSGTGEADVYKIETNNSSYVLNYYDNKGTKKELYKILQLERADTIAPNVVISTATNDGFGTTLVNLEITNILNNDYPITVKYSLVDFNDSSLVYECYTDKIISSTGDSYTSSYDYVDNLRDHGGMGYALVEVTDSSGNVAKIKDSYGNDYVFDMFYLNVSGCFAAGTQVLTASGFKNIEDIKIGEKIYAVDLETNAKVFSMVLKTHIGTANEKYNIYVGDDVIVSSSEHKFYVESIGWVKASELKQGDVLVSKQGSNTNITKIECIKLEQPITVYNLTVAKYENFLITDNEILVHNISK